MRFMKGKDRPVLALGVALVASLLMFGGIGGGGRTPEAQAQEVPELPAIPPVCTQLLDFYWRICVVKSTDPSDTGDEFDFAWDAEPAGGDTFSLEDQEGHLFGLTGNATEVTISETNLPAGWELVDIHCIAQGQDVNLNLLESIGVSGGSVEIEFGSSSPGFIYCVFFNEEVEDPDSEPTPPGGRRPPSLGGGLGGLFGAPPPATPTVVAPAAVAPSAVISPPRTGDAGLK